MEEKQPNSGLRYGFGVTDVDGNISYLTVFSLICKMRMIVVSVLRVFMKVYETVFGKQFAPNTQIMFRIIRYFIY